jgi:hypothetical protein
MIAALQGPTSITVNPVGVGEVELLRDPQVKTCGYSRLTPCRGQTGHVFSPKIRTPRGPLKGQDQIIKEGPCWMEC